MDKSRTFKLFLLSMFILVLTFLLAAFWDVLGMGTNKIPLAILITITFGISIAGLILGIYEFKKAKTIKQWIGLIGNILVILFFVFMMIYSLRI